MTNKSLTEMELSELDAKLEHIVSRMLPLVDVNVPAEKLDTFIRQRPYELSSSPDHIDY